MSNHHLCSALFGPSHRWVDIKKLAEGTPRIVTAVALTLGIVGSAWASSIPLVTCDIANGAAGTVAIQSALPGEIPGVKTDFVLITGPMRKIEVGNRDREIVWLFIDGRGTVQTKDQTFAIDQESIARVPAGWEWTIAVPGGSELLGLRIEKSLSDEDRAELGQPAFLANNVEPYVKTFAECTPYSEAIKSAKTISRTLLPENVVPRMAIGTVETAGPDQVGRHKHPMLEQLFLGLMENDSTVTADDASTLFPAYSLLHIPLGSMHGTQVSAGKKLYYVWMDFFTTKEGQSWLKMHKPIAEQRGSDKP